MDLRMSSDNSDNDRHLRSAESEFGEIELEDDEKAELTSDEVYCTSCGAAIKEEAEICPKCGVRQMMKSSAVLHTQFRMDEFTSYRK